MSAIAVPAPRSRVGLAVMTTGLTTLLVASMALAVIVGSADLSLATIWQIISHHLGADVPGLSPATDAIIWQLRLPRVLTAAMVGAGLAVCGAVMQTITQTPLADPYLLGISSGASLGAVFVIVLGFGGFAALGASAFAGALLAFGLVLLVANRAGTLGRTRLVLAGVAVAQLAAAITTFLILWAANPDATQQVTHWLSGSLAGATWTDIGFAFAVLAVCLGIVISGSRSLDAFAFGDDSAASLGVDVSRTRWLLLGTCALLTATMVSMSGAIGFVGLVVPHAVRLLTGPGHVRLLPVTALAGAIFLVWIDALGRVIFAPREIPVGVLTALIGVPVFIAILRGKQRGR